MSLWTRLTGAAPVAEPTASRIEPTVRGTSETPRAMAGQGAVFDGLGDPLLLDFMRAGGMTESGGAVSVRTALRNTTVMRCVSLISFAVGMLPLHLRRIDSKEKAVGHPLFRILHRKPNDWQTAFEFKTLMQQRALTHGNAYARIIRSGKRVLAVVPLDPGQVTPRQRADWRLDYEYVRKDGGTLIVPPEDMLHLRNGLSEDGISGLSAVRQAAEAIGLAAQTEKAAARLFRNGMLVGGMMSVKGRLSQEAFERLREQMSEREGAEQAHKWVIAEEGMEAKPFAQTGRESQHMEMRRHQIEEIARAFGVPRPLLGVDDTSWGSGVDVLGQFFVRYALSPWFECWEQAIARSLLSESEQDLYEAKFNPGALLRGSMKDQAEFFAKGLGSGGHQPFLEVDEVRGWMDLPHSDDLPPPPGRETGERADENIEQV